MPGIISYGVHVPVNRLDAATVRDAHGAGTTRGRRAVAGFDEDTTTMGVEASRRALGLDGPGPAWLYFATTDPAYAEKANATAIHAALGLPAAVGVTDMVGSVRSGTGALRVALHAAEPAMAVVADLRNGAPGGPDEIGGGDAAAAFVTAGRDEEPIAELVGEATVTEEYLDRWKLPTERVPRHWEENFGAKVSAGLVGVALRELLGRLEVDASAVDHLVVAGANRRAMKRAAKSAGVRVDAAVPEVGGEVGVSGAAHAGLLLAATLDIAGPDELIVVLGVADGVEALAFRTTERIVAHQRRGPSVAEQIVGDRPQVPYARFLAWRGLITPEAPRKAGPAGYSAPAAHRRRTWKLGFEASRCTACGTRQLPPQRVCFACREIDRMDREPMREVGGTLVTFTVDRLAWSPSPPAVFGIVDFDGGGRTELELTEMRPDDLVVGRRVEMTFRVMHTRDGRRNYFWKARPAAGEES